MDSKDSFPPSEQLASRPETGAQDFNCTPNLANQKTQLQTKRIKKLVGENTGVWDDVEIKNYFTFIIKNQRVMQKSELIRKKKMFRKMAEFICTRNFSQCTSHHQKMMQKYGTISGIIQIYRTGQFHRKLSASTEVSVRQRQQKNKGNKDRSKIQQNHGQNERYAEYSNQNKNPRLEEEIGQQSFIKKPTSAFKQFKEQQQQQNLTIEWNILHMLWLNPNILSTMLGIPGQY